MKRIILISGTIFAIDQISKWIVVEYFDLKSRFALEVFPPYLSFRMAWNEGINFGLLSNSSEIMRWGLIVVSIVIAVWLLFWGRQFTGWFGAFLVSSIVGGALGNTVDRIQYGAVADFLNMSCCGLNNPFAFNVADISIFVGAIGLVLFSEKLAKKA
jgi:signal peptidase II